ncbi:MAG: peptidyl-tRNA hydrolase [Pirellulaceae bacterium]|nr:MAG: peptidyl-tRNA hydrolase [Pirellulaceae bacterium]
MKLVAGLGNPGRQYEATRHNIGFQVLDAVARRLDVDSRRTAFDALVADGRVGSERLLLLWPQTYMNRSGHSVQVARDYYKIENDNLLVVCDDFALPLGRMRFRPDGSSGGQKGLEDVLRCCGPDVPRLRVGIGPLPERQDPARFVLSRFQPNELALVERVVQLAAEGVLDWVENGIDYCMNRYNGMLVTQENSAVTGREQAGPAAPFKC